MSEINIIVCAKQIPDPEAPLSDVSVDAEKMEVIVDAPQVISPFDENAAWKPLVQIKRRPGRPNHGSESGEEGVGYGSQEKPRGRGRQIDSASGRRL